MGAVPYIHPLLFGAIIVAVVLAMPRGILGLLQHEVPPAEDDLMRAALEVVGVTRASAACAAVNGVSLALEPGRIYGLIGPNGSGKTTLFNCITGVERCDAGAIRFDGAAASTASKPLPDRAARASAARSR